MGAINEPRIPDQGLSPEEVLGHMNDLRSNGRGLALGSNVEPGLSRRR